MPESPTACLAAQGFEPHAISLTSERGGELAVEFSSVVNDSVRLNEVSVKTLDTKTQVSFPSWLYSVLPHTDVLGGQQAPGNDGNCA